MNYIKKETNMEVMQAFRLTESAIYQYGMPTLYRTELIQTDPEVWPEWFNSAINKGLREYLDKEREYINYKGCAFLNYSVEAWTITLCNVESAHRDTKLVNVDDWIGLDLNGGFHRHSNVDFKSLYRLQES